MPQKALIPVHDVECKFNTRIKEFPDYIKIACFTRPVFNPYGVEERLTEKQEEIKWQEKLAKLRSGKKEARNKGDVSRNDAIKRARDKAYEIAFANDFEWFVTFTLSPEHIDRYDKEEILRRFKKWLNNTSSRRNMVYLMFPEYHEDKAVHFHGLISGDLEMRESGHKTTNGQMIYNAMNWTLGFSTAVRLEGQKGQIANYVMKYITKENKRVFGKHYFAGGKGLQREVPTTYENMDIHALEGTYYKIPNAPLGVKYATIQKEVSL